MNKYHEKVCRSSLLYGRNVRWPRRMLLQVSHGEYAGTCRQTDGRQTVTLGFPLDAASMITTIFPAYVQCYF